MNRTAVILMGLLLPTTSAWAWADCIIELDGVRHERNLGPGESCDIVAFEISAQHCAEVGYGAYETWWYYSYGKSVGWKVDEFECVEGYIWWWGW